MYDRGEACCVCMLYIRRMYYLSRSSLIWESRAFITGRKALLVSGRENSTDASVRRAIMYEFGMTHLTVRPSTHIET